MASVKIKFRPSVKNENEGKIFYQVIHNREVRQIKTRFKVFVSEWEQIRAREISPSLDKERLDSLVMMRKDIDHDVERILLIINSLSKYKGAFTADDVVTSFFSGDCRNSLFGFMEEVIGNLRKLGKVRTSETYASTLNSFRNYRKNKDLSLDRLNSDILQEYEAFLKNRGVSHNSSSFYMRNLRAVYNRAVEKELMPVGRPFRHVYTGVDKTVKRAVPMKVIKQIKELDLSGRPCLDYARDMFLFSFYTRGMSLIDIAYLRKKDLADGVLTYRRRKTGQQLVIRWERQMQEIVDKYGTSETTYLMPVIKRTKMDERTQYLYASHNINRNLKIIGRMLDLSSPLTMYVARHAWASIARSKNIPLSVISEGMGHDSEATTRIYLATLDSMAIDRANSLILKLL